MEQNVFFNSFAPFENKNETTKYWINQVQITNRATFFFKRRHKTTNMLYFKAAKFREVFWLKSENGEVFEEHVVMHL